MTRENIVELPVPPITNIVCVIHRLIHDHSFAGSKHKTSQLVLIHSLLSCESTFAVCNHSLHQI